MMGIAMFASCTKEATGPMDTTSALEVNVTPRVKQFVAAATDQVRSKSNGTLDADSAIWYIEAGLNYSASQAWRSFTELSIDSLVLSLDLSTGSVPESLVFDAYNTLVAQLAEVNTEEQHLYLVDVVEPTITSTPGEVLVYYQIASGYEKYNNPPNTNYPIGYIAWWCNADNPVQCNTSNLADHEIRHRINAANVIALNPYQYFHSVETWTVSNFPTSLPARNYWWRDPFMASPTPNNNGYRETLLYSWRDGASQGGKCLARAEMVYWTGNATTNGTWRGITKIRTTHCPNKIFTSCNLAGGAQTVSQPGNPLYWFHAGQFTFGLIGSGGSSS
jgi:hypothetical protein